MKRYAVFALALGFTFTVWSDFADAKRMGGGRSLGMQRSVPVQKAAPAAQPAAAPQQAAAQPAAAPQPAGKPATQPASQMPPQAAPQSRGSSWMGPLAGLAAGLGLAALASHFGFGEALANGLMIALLVVLGIVVFGWLLRRVLPHPGLAAAKAGTGGGSARSHIDLARDTWQPVQAPATGSATPSLPAASASGLPGMPSPAAAELATSTEGTPAVELPAGFDGEAFVHQAKLNFIRLQAANDAGDLSDLREFTTPGMYAELKLDIDGRRGAAQRTEVVDLEAAIVDYVEEAERWVVSVRYSGRLYENEGVVTTQLDEVWHLVKPRNGKSGWLVAGIQQPD